MTESRLFEEVLGSPLIPLLKQMQEVFYAPSHRVSKQPITGFLQLPLILE